MATLYLNEQGVTLRKEQNRLVIERDGAILSSIHDFKVERVVIFGNIQITTQAVSFLLDRGIDAAFLSLHGKLKGRLAPIESKNVLLRIKQYERARDMNFSLSLAQTIVLGKISNSIEVLSRYSRNHAECDLTSEIEKLTAAAKKLRHSDTVDRLRGAEGQAAALHFQCFKRMLRRSFSFTKRTRRPPTDPVNALLSLGYTLLYNEAIAALASTGFDPYIGFYHSADYGRCSLALDLIEEFRSVIIDRLVLNLINLGVLDSKHFINGNDKGFLLNDEGRKRFFTEYEKIMTAEFAHRTNGEPSSFRRALHEQALVMQKTVMNGCAYKPFQGRH